MILRVFTWIAAVMLALSLALWAASLFGIEWQAGKSRWWICVLEDGALRVHRWNSWPVDPRGERDNPSVRGLMFQAQAWWPQSGVFTDLGHPLVVDLPLWMPTIASASLLSGGVWLSGRARRRRKAGRCAACGYSRAGLAIDAPCPECGQTADGMPRG